MEFPDRLLVVEIVNGLVVALANFHEICRQLPRFGIALFQISLEIAAVASNHFA